MSERVVAMETSESREAEVRDAWAARAPILDQAIAEMNARMASRGVAFTCCIQPADNTEDIARATVTERTSGLSSGELRIHRTGIVSTCVSSGGFADWKKSTTTIASLDRAFIDEFLADVLEEPFLC